MRHPTSSRSDWGDKLPQAIFTPSTKAQLGAHDQNVAYENMLDSLGENLSGQIRDISLAIYNFAAQKLEPLGILLADTKFEFGLYKNQLFLIDEVLTPDSSRYWRQKEYNANQGHIPPGLDKQLIRDYVEQSGWNKSPPAPHLPQSILQKTRQIYQEIQAIINKALID